MARAAFRMLATLVFVLGGLSAAPRAEAQNLYNNNFTSFELNRYYYYPYAYFPHNYWPATSPKWPEAPGMPYMKPPAYQTYPPYREYNWRYELWQAQPYYRGFHFWLDQF